MLYNLAPAWQTRSQLVTPPTIIIIRDTTHGYYVSHFYPRDVYLCYGVCGGFVALYYFVLMTGDAPPEYVQKLSRNFANLLEVPMLFYVLGAFVMALDINNSALVQHAWLFVGLRVVHSIIHVTYNHVIHRFTVFVLSTLALLAMWIQLISLVG